MLQALPQEANTREIAQQFGIRSQTVATHICKIVRKLAAKNRAEAIAWAWTHGLIENP